MEDKPHSSYIKVSDDGYRRFRLGFLWEMIIQRALKSAKVTFTGNAKDFIDWLSNVGYNHDINVLGHLFEAKWNDPHKPFYFSYYEDSWKKRNVIGYIVNDINHIPDIIKWEIRHDGKLLFTLQQFIRYAQSIQRDGVKEQLSVTHSNRRELMFSYSVYLWKSFVESLITPLVTVGYVWDNLKWEFTNVVSFGVVNVDD